MVKQRGLGQNNQKELTQNGDEHKEEKQSPRAEQRRSTASRAQCFLVGIGDWLKRVGPVATPTAQRRCRRTGRAATPLYGSATSFLTVPSL